MSFDWLVASNGLNKLNKLTPDLIINGGANCQEGDGSSFLDPSVDLVQTEHVLLLPEIRDEKRPVLGR